MASPAEGARAGVRVQFGGEESLRVSTGLPVLDHLLGLLAQSGGFGLTLEVAPGSAEAEVAEAGAALGSGLHHELRASGVRGHGSAVVPADEALAHVTLEASGRPLVVSNVDLSAARVGGLDTDLVARFLQELAEGAGLTLHIRLLNGNDTQHVLEAIFKALGVALAQARRQRRS